MHTLPPLASQENRTIVLIKPDDDTRAIAPPDDQSRPTGGERLRLRSAGPEDALAEAELLARAGDQTRWLRLGGAGIPEARYADLLRLDPGRDRAWLIESQQTRRVIAVARYAATADVAEAAFLVDDAWQGYGLGRLMLETLITDATSRGHLALHADILAVNRPMIRLALRLGMDLLPHPEGASMRRARLALAALRGTAYLAALRDQAQPAASGALPIRKLRG